MSLFSLIKKTKSGFTLLELLVSVAIIGILISIGTVAFTTAQQRSRDARRRGDMKAWQDAMEQTFSKHTSYTGGGTGCAVAISENMNGVQPVDPKNSSPYVYNASCTSDDYCICATLEQSGSGNNDSNNNCDSFENSGDYFCVSALQ